MIKRLLNLDAIGITASVACAIHCAVLPLFLTSIPLFGINILDSVVFEAGMIILSFCIGGFALIHGFKRHHHQILPLLVFHVGFLLLVLKEFFIVDETWLIIPAVVLIVTAHLFNYTYCRKANHCHAADCEHL